jgi:muramidase (phage lysozyme)
MGNPTLMAGWIYPSDTMGKDGKASGEDVKKTKEAHDKKIGMTTSGIKTVKINIRMPKPSYLQGAPSGDDNNFYSSPFWNSNSNFQIHDILSKFTKGKFIQILKLVGQPTTSGVVGGSSTKASQPAKEGDKPTESNDVSGDNLRAFLKMIGMAETGLQGNDGYNILQGGKTFADYSEHPYSHKAVPKSGPAAGRYQIEVATYNGLKSKCGGDFSPGAQDKMAVQLLKNYSAYDLVIAGKPAAAIKAVYRCWTALNPSSKSGKSEKQLLGWYESYGGTYKPQTSEPNASQNASPSKPADSKSVPTGSNGGKLNKVSKGGTNGNWAGSADKLQEVLPNGEYAPSSEKRDRVKTKSGHVSDHYTGNPNAYAVDLGLNNTYGGDKSKANAAALATVNNVRRQEGKAPFASWSQIPRGEYSGTTPDGYRVQVIWDSDVGGNHHDHIHVGVKKK